MYEGDRLGYLKVFGDILEPSDIRLGSMARELRHDYFLSAVAILAQAPLLLERLFVTREWNPEGIYRVRICKGGEWQEVTVDDLFPCEPNGAPLFSSCMNGELWLMILEKAYAKVHGSYFLLKDGFVHEALMDLSGCPTSSYNLKDDQVQHFISNGQFWELMKYFKTEGYLLSLSAAGEGLTAHEKLATSDSNSQDGNPLPPGQGFAITSIKDLGPKGKILCLRAPLEKYNW